MASVLHVHIVGNQFESWDDPEVALISTTWMVQRTNEDPISDAGFTLSVTLKTLGVYKTPVQMNNRVLDDVAQHVEDVHGINKNSYDARYLSGAYGLLNI